MINFSESIHHKWLFFSPYMSIGISCFIPVNQLMVIFSYMSIGNS